MTQKSLIQMQISPIKNQNFEKRLGIHLIGPKWCFWKKFFWISLKKFLVPHMLSHRWNVLTSKFWRKSKETKRNFFRKFTKGIYGFDLGKKKIQIISCLCTFKGLLNDQLDIQYFTGPYNSIKRHVLYALSNLRLINLNIGVTIIAFSIADRKYNN